VDTLSYNFITCDGNFSPVIFFSYLEPFAKNVLFLIGTSVIGTALVLLAIVRLLQKKPLQ